MKWKGLTRKGPAQATPKMTRRAEQEAQAPGSLASPTRDSEQHQGSKAHRRRQQGSGKSSMQWAHVPMSPRASPRRQRRARPGVVRQQGKPLPSPNMMSYFPLSVCRFRGVEVWHGARGTGGSAITFLPEGPPNCVPDGAGALGVRDLQQGSGTYRCQRFGWALGRHND